MSPGGRGFALVAALACAALVVCCFVGRVGRLRLRSVGEVAAARALLRAADAERDADSATATVFASRLQPRRLPSARAIFAAACVAGIAAAWGAFGSLGPSARRTLLVVAGTAAIIVAGLVLFDVLELDEAFSVEASVFEWEWGAAGPVMLALATLAAGSALYAARGAGPAPTTEPTGGS